MKLLFLPSNNTALNGMINLYSEAQKRGHTCLFLVEPQFHNMNGNYNKVNLGLKNTVSSKLFSFRTSAFFPKVFIKISLILKKYSIDSLYNNNRKKMYNWLELYFKREKEVEKIINIEKPDAIYTYGDRHGGYEPAVIKIANKKQIPVIIPPIAYHSDKESLLISARKYIYDKQFCVTENFNFKIKYPKQWVHDDKTGEDFSYYPLWMVNARDKYGVLPANPWFQGTGGSTIICADGEASRKRFISNGVSPEKIKLTGHYEHDMLYHNLQDKEKKKESIYNKYGFNSNEPLIVLSLPQTFEHKILSKKDHFILQKTLCFFASSTNWNVLVSLHPKMKLSLYKFLEEKYKVTICNEKLSEILPIANLYIVGQGSSTVLWSVLCEIPTLIADWYGLNYTMYDKLKGVKIEKSKNNFSKTLSNLTHKESKILKSMKDGHKEQKYLFSPFDGKCSDRIFNAF